MGLCMLMSCAAKTFSTYTGRIVNTCNTAVNEALKCETLCAHDHTYTCTYKATVCCKRVSGHPPACIFEGRVKWPLLSLFTLRMLNGVCIVHPV